MTTLVQLNKTVSPALWELEFRIADLTAEQTGIERDRITPGSRLLEDLGIDSLDFVELLMSLEEAFNIVIPDDLNTKMFVREPLTISVLAEVVSHQWGTGKPPRERWFSPFRSPVTDFATPPFTQLAGKLSTADGRQTALYDPMSAGPGGHAQLRRRIDGMRCVVIPGARVEIGSEHSLAAGDERPLHHVELGAFLMDAEPVSVAAYCRFLNSTVGVKSPLIATWCGVAAHDRRGRHFQLQKRRRAWEPVDGTAQQPMVLVSWFGAAAYSLWTNQLDWNEFRHRALLPSEAQWEYAARGVTSRVFPWGDGPADGSLALFELHRVRQRYPGLLPLAPVQARLGVSPFGLHHMAGNVWQWCQDWYDPHFYQCPEAGSPNPLQTIPTGIRAERGGSWVGPAELGRSSFRRGRPPAAVGRCLGFRCVGTMDRLPSSAS
jgi:formylglycine-generating enzyme